MTPERAKELLPIINAFANGEAIQTRHAMQYGWLDISQPNWCDSYEYRVKPKTPEYRLFQWSDKSITAYFRNTKRGACAARPAAGTSGKWITDWLPIPNYQE